MSNNCTIINHENINGVNLCLEIEKRKTSPISQRYTITYRNKEQKSPALAIKPIILAVAINALAIYCFYIKIQDILIIVSLLFFIVMFWMLYSVQSESILVIPAVGIQVTVQYVYNKDFKLVPWSDIKDIIINEVIQSNRVIYTLLILVKNEGSTTLVPLFKYTKPRLLMLETIYTELQELLKSAAFSSSDGHTKSDLAGGDEL